MNSTNGHCTRSVKMNSPYKFPPPPFAMGSRTDCTDLLTLEKCRQTSTPKGLYYAIMLCPCRPTVRPSVSRIL